MNLSRVTWLVLGTTMVLVSAVIVAAVVFINGTSQRFPRGAATGGSGVAHLGSAARQGRRPRARPEPPDRGHVRRTTPGGGAPRGGRAHGIARPRGSQAVAALQARRAAGAAVRQQPPAAERKARRALSPDDPGRLARALADCVRMRALAIVYQRDAGAGVFADAICRAGRRARHVDACRDATRRRAIPAATTPYSASAARCTPTRRIAIPGCGRRRRCSRSCSTQRRPAARRLPRRPAPGRGRRRAAAPQRASPRSAGTRSR